MFSTPPGKTRETALVEHLSWWGLRRFETDEAYFRWQRDMLSSDELAELHRLVAVKRTATVDSRGEIAFYDRAADARILPVLYSQRYDYYLAVGPLVAERIVRMTGKTGLTSAVLDFGCGIGLLTTFYALQFPTVSFVGIDRSAASIFEAQTRCKALGLTNVRFECLDLSQAPLPEQFGLIISTQALLQSEQDPGLPSMTWQTFERTRDTAAQSRFEQQTGLGSRLDLLCRALPPGGWMLVFEKTRTLSRRVPFQRAFADRGFRLLDAPLPIRYRIVEEVSDEGPFYVMSHGSAGPAQPGIATDWDESPEPDDQAAWCRYMGRAADTVRTRLPDRLVLDERQSESPFGPVKSEQGRSGVLFAYYYWDFHEKGTKFLLIEPLWGRDAVPEPHGHHQPRPEALTWLATDEREDPQNLPLYEGHSAVAQELWESLPNRQVVKEQSWERADGYQMHVELGMTGGLAYLYQANTFDQRQLVMIEPHRTAQLEQYYQEIVQNAE